MKPACILFSGGADSTLAAVLMQEKYRPVHLLSFHHHHMSQLEKTNHSANQLQTRFGKEVFLHQWLDMTEHWNQLKKASPGTAFNFQGLFAFFLKPCISCKIAMHQMTLSYCQQNQINTVADGAHPDGAALFPEQLEQGIEILRQFYLNHNIHYMNPVYYLKEPDVELYNREITMKKKTKNEHVYYTNQFACHVGLLAYLHHYLTRPFDKDKGKTFQLSLEFLKRGLT